MNTTINIPIAQLATALRTLPEAIQASADTALNLPTAQALAKTLCPARTGALRETIKVSRPSNTEAFLTAGDPSVTYAQMVHDGTSRQAPRPFLYQALQAETPRITQEIIQGTVTQI